MCTVTVVLGGNGQNPSDYCRIQHKWKRFPVIVYLTNRALYSLVAPNSSQVCFKTNFEWSTGSFSGLGASSQQFIFFNTRTSWFITSIQSLRSLLFNVSFTCGSPASRFRLKEFIVKLTGLLLTHLGHRCDVGASFCWSFTMVTLGPSSTWELYMSMELSWTSSSDVARSSSFKEIILFLRSAIDLI